MSAAERWVDEMATLRVLTSAYGLEFARSYGLDGTSISDRYGTGCTEWDLSVDPGWTALGIDRMRQLADGTRAARRADTGRWEAYRG